MKIIVCGAGQVGYQIAKYLCSEDIDVTIIDIKDKLVRRASDTLDVRAVCGYASHPDILENAGAKDADMIIAVTHLDEVNMLTCQVAYSLFNIPVTIARIRHQGYLNPIWSNLFGRDHLPIDVTISPEAEVAKAISRRLHVPGAIDMIKLVEDKVTILGLRCHDVCPLLHTPLEQLSALFPDLHVSIVGIIRNDKMMTPKPNDQLLPADEVYFCVETEQLTRLLSIFGIEDDEAHNIVVVGGGNIGHFLCKDLEKESPIVQTKLIEMNPQRAEFVAQNLLKTSVLNGDVMDSEIIEAAHFDDTDNFIAVTDDDEVNILASLLAKRHGCLKATALINTSTYRPLLPALGIDVVIDPKDITVSSILSHVRRGRIRSVHSLREGYGEIIEADAVETSPLVGKPLRDANLPFGVIVGAIVRNDQVITPHGDTVINGKDRVVIYAPANSVKKVEKMFCVRLEYF